MLALVLAGGSGSRLWPLSRQFFPKQLLNVGDKKYSLIQNTILRLSKTVSFKNIFTISNVLHRDSIINQLYEINDCLVNNVIFEPVGKNTAPAILLSLLYIEKLFSGDEVIAIMPADHLIKDEELFNENLVFAKKVAKKGKIVTFGIIPEYPSSGYGYIKKTKNVISKEGNIVAYEVEKFIEKPDINIAKEFLKSRDYLWNSGMFIFKISVMIDMFKRYLPNYYDLLSHIDIKNLSEITDTYNKMESISIDNGIMEKINDISVIPVDFGWSDIGDFKALYELNDKDKNNNVVKGKVISLDCKNSFIFSESDRLIAAVDLDDVVIVDSDDATLICSKDSTQRVKEIYSKIKEKGENEAFFHKTVYRPWGYFVNLSSGNRHKIKRIVVYPGKRLSLQRHFHRSEHWTVVSGTAKIVCGEREFFLHVNESTYIPPATLHRLENPGKIELHIVEIQVGDYTGEDDIERIEDDYKR